MTRCLGTWLRKRWRIFNRIGGRFLTLAALTMVLAGCNAIGLLGLALFPVKVPTASGTWRGTLTPVEVIDEGGEKHTVKGIILVEALDIEVDAPEGWNPERLYRSFPNDPSQAAFFIQDGMRLIPNDHTPAHGNSVIFTGRVGYRENPTIAGRRAIRLSRAAVVVESDGTEHREFTSGTELVAIGKITLETQKREHH